MSRSPSDRTTSSPTWLSRAIGSATYSFVPPLHWFQRPRSGPRRRRGGLRVHSSFPAHFEFRRPQSPPATAPVRRRIRHGSVAIADAHSMDVRPEPLGIRSPFGNPAIRCFDATEPLDPLDSDHERRHHNHVESFCHAGCSLHADPGGDCAPRVGGPAARSRGARGARRRPPVTMARPRTPAWSPRPTRAS